VHYAASALGPVIVDSLQLSATQFGLLWLATLGAAARLATTAGPAADRFGARGMLVSVFGLSTIAPLVVGTAPGYVWLFLGLALSGAAQSLSNPATNALVTSDVRPQRQGLVLGIKQSGVQASQLFAGLALPALALLVGWRSAVAACAVIGLAGILLTFALVPRRPAGSRRDRGPRVPLRATVGRLTAYSFLTGAIVQATNVYLPLYANQDLGASVTEAGLPRS
jgi:MFS family permease